MYLRKPSAEHEDALNKYMSQMSSETKATLWPAGGALRQEAYDNRGFKAWLCSLTALNNADLRKEPGITYLIADPIDTTNDPFFNKDEVPMFPNGDLLVGIVSFLGVYEWLDEVGGVATTSCPKDTAALYISLLPSYGNTSGFLRALQDSLTHIVCEGLPYKDVVCLVPKDSACPNFIAALSRCTFQWEGTLDRDTDMWRVDLRTAHLLRYRIQTYNYEREE